MKVKEVMINIVITFKSQTCAIIIVKRA